MNGKTDNTPASVFDVWASYDWHEGRTHYPEYKIHTCKVGSAFDLTRAEQIIQDVVRDDENNPNGSMLHSLRIIEIPEGEYATKWCALSEYIYDRKGNFLDSRTFPRGGRYPGRKKEEIRFKPGDLCEVLIENEYAWLGFITEVPPSVEKMSSGNTKGIYFTDDLADTYTVNCDYNSAEPIDSLYVFKPQHKIPARLEKWFHDQYNDYLTFPTRMKIADTTAEAQLRGFIEDLGWNAVILAPLDENCSFKLTIQGVPRFPEGVILLIDQDKAWHHMNRIQTTFLRLAGKPTKGRGYRLKPWKHPDMVDKEVYQL